MVITPMLYTKHVLRLYIITLVIFTTNQCFASIDQTVLPLSFSPQGMPAATVEIQGKKIPLAFDTESDTIALSEDIIKKQHLNIKILPEDKTKCYHGSTSKEHCLKSFIIPTLKVGDFTLHNIPGAMRDYMWGEKPEAKFIMTQPYHNGVLGLNVLRQFNLLIDYPHEQAILLKQDLYPKNYKVKNWIKIPFALNKYGINTKAKINGIDTTLSWITAANHSVIMPPTMKKIAPAPPAYISFVPDKLIVENIEIPNAEFHIVDDGFPFEVIGSSYFQEHVVFIDFKNQYLFIQE
jgi:hypothetical protein